MIPFNDLSRRVEQLRGPLEKRFSRILDGGKFILGESVARLEDEFARYCGVRHGVGVASGTDAIWLALEGLGIGDGDEVLTVANTCAPTISAILKCGATPVLVDVDPETLTMDAGHAERAISRRSRCLLPVHLYGQCADMKPLRSLARRRGLFLVEDCAQAHGASYRGRRAGSLGDAGAFSFYPTKNLGALGDGGMVVTNNSRLADRIRLLRNYGYSRPNQSSIKGYNSRLDELQAGLLLEALPTLESANARRREIARAYSAAFASAVGLKSPVESPNGIPVYHLYVARVAKRDFFRKTLLARGVDTAVHYPVAIHKQKGYARLCRIGQGGLQATEKAAAEIVSLPLYPELGALEIEKVIAAAINACLPKRV